jgi:hypothetical protein
MSKMGSNPNLSPMEAGYLILLYHRENRGKITGGNWGRKNIRKALVVKGLVEYEKLKEITLDTGKKYDGHPIKLTEFGRHWSEWFEKAYFFGEPGHWYDKDYYKQIKEIENRADIIENNIVNKVEIIIEEFEANGYEFHTVYRDESVDEVSLVFKVKE